jgi:Ca2+/Na+ antiporter
MLDALLAIKPEAWRRIGRGWTVVGSLGLVFLVIMGIAVFFYDEPVIDRNTGQAMKRSDVALAIIAMGLVCGFFVIAGRFVISRLKTVTR